MKGVFKKTAALVAAAALLLCLCACGDGPIMRVVSDETSVEQRELPPREGKQRWTVLAPEDIPEGVEGLRELQKLVDEKYVQLEGEAKKAYLSNSKYYMLLAGQLKSKGDDARSVTETLAAYESTAGQSAAAEAEAEPDAMTAEEYEQTLSFTREGLLALLGELDDIITRFNDYMIIMNALVNHNGIFGLISKIKTVTWEGSYPTGYFFNDDIPLGADVSLMLDGSEYVKRFGVGDAELYALGYGSADKAGTLKLIDTMRGKGLLSSVMNEDDGLQWYGSWIDTGGRTCYYFIWFKEGGLGSIVDRFVGQSVERIVVAGSFDFMTCVLASLNM